MYEIPPSVDWYLRTSSKSRIHYPAVYFEKEACLSPLNGVCCSPNEECPKLQEENDLNSPELATRSSSNHLNKKRKVEEFEDNSGVKRLRSSPKDDFYPPDNLLALGPRSNYPLRLDKTVAIQDTVMKNHHQIPMMQERRENKCLRIQTLVDKFPEFIPKLNGDTTSTCSPQHHGNNVPRKNPWGSQSYSDLISSAIASFPSNMATLQQIYEWIVTNIPHFADKADYPSTKGWKNAIRHTLSIRKRFTRIVNHTSPHSSLWTFSKHSQAMKF